MEQVLDHPGWASFWGWLGGTIVAPVRTLREVVLADAWPQALALLLGSAALQTILGLGELVVEVIAYPGRAAGPGVAPWWVLGPASPLAAASGPLGVLTTVPAGWTAASLVYYLIALLLGGRGSFTGLWAAIGFANLPSLLFVPVAVVLWVATMLGPTAVVIVGLLALMVAFPVASWSVALQVIAVREAMSLGTGRAALTVLVPVGVLLTLALLVGCVVLVVLIAIHAGQTPPSSLPSV
ncbi:MAG TPA: YIP1 family protein [Thermomicrobiaceae bacterium]|nr:YIP1 family protein [Thermomicrobiaceae bacterium]